MFLKNKIKAFLNKPFLRKILNKFFLKNKISVSKGNVLNIDRLISKSDIKICGKNNTVNIKRGAKSKIKIFINGNGNKINVQENVFLGDTVFWIEEDNSEITIGKNTTLSGKIQFSAIEGTKITVGEDCLFSDTIDVRTGDGHAVLDENKVRINKSMDVLVEDRVWCGRDVKILKGAKVLHDSVIGTGSIVTKPIEKSNVSIAGAPAKIIKENISWDYNR